MKWKKKYSRILGSLFEYIGVSSLNIKQIDGIRT
jgi:hypothetical protein